MAWKRKHEGLRRGIKRYKTRTFKGRLLDKELGFDIPQIYGLSDAPQKCSCPFCCGNPRHIRGENHITMDERMSIVNYNEGLIEWLEG
jgi:hypothetical protein